MNKNPYVLLGVSQKATQDEIKTAYRNLAKKLHPDLNPGNKEAEKKFKEINAAYELVGTAEMRDKFDRGELDENGAKTDPAGARTERGPFYNQTQAGGGRYGQSFEGMDEDMLRSIFGERFGFSGDRPGHDVVYQMEVDFKDSSLGAEREITLPSGKRLRVKIPPGVSSGAKLRFAGYGSPGTGKAPAGDAYVELKVKSSAMFKRIGNDLEIELPISLSEAILGAEVKVPTIDGSVLMKVPAGVTTGSKLRVVGKGIASATGKRGDQFAVLKVVIPPNIDADFKQAVESWNKRQSFDPRASWAAEREGGL